MTKNTTLAVLGCLLAYPAVASAQEAGLECDAGIYEAETMVHSTGGGTDGGWNIWSNGFIAMTHNFPGGAATLRVIARGQSAAGEAPNMMVTIGGDVVFVSAVAHTDWAEYSFEVEVAAGPQEVQVHFTNDYNLFGEDRDLHVDKVIVECEVGWRDLVLRNGWQGETNSRVPAVGLVNGVVTFRGALDGTSATSEIPFCLTDGQVGGPDFSAYRPVDAGYMHVRAALGGNAFGTLALDFPFSPEIPPEDHYCLHVEEIGAAVQPGPNARTLTSLEGVSFDRSLEGSIFLQKSPQWDASPYPKRGSDGNAHPEGAGISAKVVNGFVRFQAGTLAANNSVTSPVLFTLPAGLGLRPGNPVYVPVSFGGLEPQVSGRLLIRPNGDVEAEGAFQKALSGVSLDGASYSISSPPSAELIDLAGNWIAHSSRAVRARVDGGIVRLEGAVRDGDSAVLGTLPPGMRPAAKIFLVANAIFLAQPSTVSVDTNGVVEVISPPMVVATSGISLDGVSFSLDGSGSFQCVGECLNAESISRHEQSGSFETTGEKWFVVSDHINGWQASEMTGRTITVNGVELVPGETPLPPAIDGMYYFQFSEGNHPWASWSFW